MGAVNKKGETQASARRQFPPLASCLQIPLANERKIPDIFDAHVIAFVTLAATAYQAGQDLDDQTKHNAYHLTSQITGALAYAVPTEQLLAQVTAQNESIQRLIAELRQLRRVCSHVQPWLHTLTD